MDGIVDVWFDYVCPWCYLALDRADHLEAEHGLGVRWRPYELHPETPEGGVEVRAGGGGAGAQLRAAGLPVRGVTRLFNSHRALALSAAVARHPGWERLHRGLFTAVFADPEDISRVEVLERVARHAGVEVEIEEAVRDGEPQLEASIAEAHEAGVAATPGWRFPGGAVLTGAHPVEVLDRVVRRLPG